MAALSIFVDESGDFGTYSPHSPYYIVTMLFHDQNYDVNPQRHGNLSKSELLVFHSERELKKQFLKPIQKKMFDFS